MSEEPEQIGPLIFVANPDYPYPFDVPEPPRFWMEEQTGALAAAVEAYMNGEAMQPDQMELIRVYLRQYLERAVIADNANRKQLLSRIERLRQTRDLERFADELSEYGIEAF
jgi:hypothetical protein